MTELNNAVETIELVAAEPAEVLNTAGEIIEKTNSLGTVGKATLVVGGAVVVGVAGYYGYKKVIKPIGTKVVTTVKGKFKKSKNEDAEVVEADAKVVDIEE